MNMPSEVEMKLTATHPMVPGGLMYPFFSEKDKKKLMEDPERHFIWNSPFYDVTDKVSAQLTLNVYDNAKSNWGKRIFNNIETELTFLPKDQSMLKPLLENNITGYGTYPERKYAISLSHTLGPIKKSNDVHVREYVNDRLVVTTLMNDSSNSRVNIYPQLTYEFLKNAKHIDGTYSAKNGADKYEKESFEKNKHIALGRLKSQINGNASLPDLVSELLKNISYKQ